MRILLLLPMLLVLSACSSPPKLMSPQPELPDNWTSAEGSDTEPVSEELRGWLVQLNDPRLQELATEALAANP
ncbi:MAG: RND transporter, partial [Marinobacterium sp.]